jgi:hypothetical protein
MKQFTNNMFNDYCKHKESYNRWYFEYTSAIGALTDESTESDYEDIKFIKSKLDELEIYIKPYEECLK